MMRLAVVMLACLVLASPLRAECEQSVTISSPRCGEILPDGQTTVVVTGEICGACTGTVSIANHGIPGDLHQVPIVPVSPECLETPPRLPPNGPARGRFEATVPVVCGCQSIWVTSSVSLPGISSAIARIHVGAASFVLIGEQWSRVGGCAPAGDSCVTCTGESSPGAPLTGPGGSGGPGGGPGGGGPGGGGAGNAPTTSCEGGAGPCFSSRNVTVTGGVGRPDATVTLAGPINSVIGVVSTTPSFVPAFGFWVYPFVAADLLLNEGPNAVAYTVSTTSSTFTTSLSMCVNSTSLPRVCLTFVAPADGSVVQGTVTTVVGQVSPASAVVRVSSSVETRIATPSSGGDLAVPIALVEGPNVVRMAADVGATHVEITRGVTATMGVFVAILDPRSGATVAGPGVAARGSSTPGSTVVLQGPGVATPASTQPDGSWQALVSGY
ncbi:MAG: hypothetical protein HY815_10730, partial [Candidatus Riflebacteria bacterium]|nr:hypothetical protein [Candidatus Riflebacteria bacterium]